MHKTHLRLVLLAIIAVWLVLLTFMPSHHETEDAGPLPVLGSVSGFVLTNQFGTPFDSRSLEGHVWVADVFFSRCPGPCVRLATNLKRLQDQLPAGNAVRLVSLTADAAYDQPPILERYADEAAMMAHVATFNRLYARRLFGDFTRRDRGAAGAQRENGGRCERDD